MKEEFKLLSPNQLKPSELNPRELDEEVIAALSENIKQVGLLQNLVVTPNEQREGYYTVILGEQRWRAASHNGEKELPCRILYDITEEEQMLMMLSENQMRKSFTAAEVGKLVGLLREKGMHVEDISKRLGWSKLTLETYKKIGQKSTPTIRKLLAPVEHKRIPKGKIGTRAAEVITGLDIPPEKKDEIAEQLAKDRLPTSVVEALRDLVKDIPNLSIQETFKKAEVLARGKRVQQAFEGGKLHRSMMETAAAILQSKGWQTKVSLPIIGTKPDVIGVLAQHAVLVECETLRTIFKKVKPNIEGYDVTRILVLPHGLLTRYNMLWFVNEEIKELTFTFPRLGEEK